MELYTEVVLVYRTQHRRRFYWHRRKDCLQLSVSSTVNTAKRALGCRASINNVREASLPLFSLCQALGFRVSSQCAEFILGSDAHRKEESQYGEGSGNRLDVVAASGHRNAKAPRHHERSCCPELNYTAVTSKLLYNLPFSFTPVAQV